MAREERKKEDLYIKEKRKSKRLFVTSSAAMSDNIKVTSTTISSSIFEEMSASFADGIHLLDSAVLEVNKPILYMIQQIEEDLTDVFNEVSASAFQSSYFPFSNADTGSFGVISSSLLPDADDNHSLGSSTKEWKDLYIDGTAYIDTLDLGTNLSATKIGANTNISNTEYGYLNGVSSNIQTQLNGKLSTSGGTITGRIQETTTAFTDRDSTPDVSGGNKFKTTNTRATTITALDNIRDGQEVTIVINDANTDFTHNARGSAGEMRLNGARNWTASAAGDTITFIGMDIDGRGTVVAFEKCRSDNT